MMQDVPSVVMTTKRNDTGVTPLVIALCAEALGLPFGSLSLSWTKRKTLTIIWMGQYLIQNPSNHSLMTEGKEERTRHKKAPH